MMTHWQQTGWKNGRPTFAPKAAVIGADRTDRIGKALASDSCRVVREGQEAMCPTCGLRWSLDEDRPECGR